MCLRIVPRAFNATVVRIYTTHGNTQPHAAAGNGVLETVCTHSFSPIDTLARSPQYLSLPVLVAHHRDVRSSPRAAMVDQNHQINLIHRLTEHDPTGARRFSCGTLTEVLLHGISSPHT